MKLRAMVTGGAGFIGSHLCDALLAEGYSVVAIDNLLTGRMSNLEHLRHEANFEFLQTDINRPFIVGRSTTFFILPRLPVRSTIWSMVLTP